MSGSQTDDTTNTTPSQDPHDDNTTPVVAEDSAAASPSDQQDGDTTPPPAPAKVSDAPAKRPWYDRRIADLTRARHERDARIQELEARINELSVPPEERRLPQTPEELNAVAERLASEKAQKMAARQSFDMACNDVYKAGKTEYSDFDTVLGNFSSLGGLSVELIEAALATEAAHKVLYHLGNNLDEADSVMQKSPLQRVAALTKLAVKLTTPPPPPKISSAPKPIPVGGARAAMAPVEDPEKMDTAAWMRWRDSQIRERQKSR